MVTAITVKEKIQGLIAKSNNTTGNSDTTLTDAVNALVEGYGAGSAAIIEPITITENGVYEVPEPVLEWDTDWKFKEEISAQAFEEIFATYPEDIYYGISIGSTEKWTISITRATNENGFFGDLITLPDNKAVYSVECQDSEGIDNRAYACFDGWTEEEFAAFNEACIAADNGPAMIKGWYVRDYKKNEYYASSAPTISAVPESFTTIDLALLSALFELEKIDGYGPVTVAVAPTVEPITITENGVYPVPKGAGGTIEFGKEYKFKDVITEADFEQYVAKATSSVEDHEATIYLVGMTHDGGSEYELQVMHIAIPDTDTSVWALMLNRSTGFSYGINASLVNPDMIDNCWTGNAEKTPIDTPTIVLDECDTMSADLAAASIFFDVETKSLDGWGDITVNVAGTSKLTNATIAKNGLYEAPLDLSMAFVKNLKLKEKYAQEDFDAYTSAVAPDEGTTDTWSIVKHGSTDFNLTLKKKDSVYTLESSLELRVSTYTIESGWRNDADFPIDAPWGYILPETEEDFNNAETLLAPLAVFFDTSVVEAYGDINVDVKPRIKPITITAVGTYDPSIPKYNTDWTWKAHIDVEDIKKIISQLEIETQEEIMPGITMTQYSMGAPFTYEMIGTITDGVSTVYQIMLYRHSGGYTMIPQYIGFDNITPDFKEFLNSMSEGGFPEKEGWYEGGYAATSVAPGVWTYCTPPVWYSIYENSGVSAELWAPFIDTGVDGYGPITVENVLSAPIVKAAWTDRFEIIDTSGLAEQFEVYYDGVYYKTVDASTKIYYYEDMGSPKKGTLISAKAIGKSGLGEADVSEYYLG